MRAFSSTLNAKPMAATQRRAAPGGSTRHEVARRRVQGGVAVARARNAVARPEPDRGRGQRRFGRRRNAGQWEQLPPPAPQSEGVPELSDVADDRSVEHAREPSEPEGVRPNRAQCAVELARFRGCIARVGGADEHEIRELSRVAPARQPGGEQRHRGNEPKPPAARWDRGSTTWWIRRGRGRVRSCGCDQTEQRLRARAGENAQAR
jgi:hypothetical protein